MAIPESIKKLANDIRTKIYGKEVREALAEGIEEAGDLADKANTKSENAVYQVNNIQAQVNQLVVEGDSSVEAAQARVDAEGKSYPTLKARLDAKETEFSSQLEQKAKIILSDKEPSDVDDETFWYEDRGEAPINFSPDGAVIVANAAVSDTEPGDTDNLWFDVK